MYFPYQIHADQQTHGASIFSSRVQLEQGNQGTQEFSFLQVDIFTLRLFLS
jgi:hypothetical protein